VSRLVIHAGLHKTGSTFLQAALKAGTAPLKNAGTGVIGHEMCKSAPWWTHIGAKGKTAAPPETVRSLETCLAGIRETLGPGPGTIVLSNERLFGHMSDISPAKGPATFYTRAEQRLARLLGLVEALPEGLITRVDLFFFFRKQSRFLSSAYGQSINEGRDPGTFEVFAQRLNLDDFSWVDLLARLEVLRIRYPFLTLRAEPYEGWIGEGFLPRFLAEIVGVPDLDLTDWKIKPIANPSLSPRGMELALGIRKLCSAEEWVTLRRTLQRSFFAKTPEDRNWLPPEFLARCKARFEAENRNLPGVAGLDDYF